MRPPSGFDPELIAKRLAALYDREFGGKPRGRYRIAMKHLRTLGGGRARLFPEDITAIGRALYQQGYILIDLEIYFVVLSQRTFASYRRVNDHCLTK